MPIKPITFNIARNEMKNKNISSTFSLLFQLNILKARNYQTTYGCKHLIEGNAYVVLDIRQRPFTQ